MYTQLEMYCGNFNAGIQFLLYGVFHKNHFAKAKKLCVSLYKNLQEYKVKFTQQPKDCDSHKQRTREES